MIHTTLVPNSKQVQFEIPSEYIGKEIEIIAFTKDEGILSKTKTYKKPSDYFGTVTVEEGQKMQDYLTQSRKEWERDI